MFPSTAATTPAYNAHELLYAAETAAKDYQNKPLWNGLISRGMAKDFSWKKAAAEYLEIIKNKK